jgi:acetyltransferase-like isoleucine patch superfamily enzyme
MTRTLSLRQRWDRLFRRLFWRMDIHASAWIAASAMIDRTWPRGIHIGADCVIGEDAVILTHDMTRGLYRDTRIGAGTIIGPRAIILPGVTVGARCLIQPGALINRDVPDDHVAQGNPAVATPR